MGIEQKGDDINIQQIVTILALSRAGMIKSEDVGPENAMVLGYYRGVMEEDPKFKAAVIKKQNEICLREQSVEKRPIFSQEELEKAKKHRNLRKFAKKQTYRQPELWKDPPRQDLEPYTHDQVIDPEKRIFKEFEKLNNRYVPFKSTYIPAEIKHKRNELRGLINLPVVRGKDPYINDPFYKFLVKNIVKNDTFGIFEEYEHVIDIIPEHLGTKIEKVKTFINEVLAGSLNMSQKYKEYHQFLEYYLEE